MKRYQSWGLALAFALLVFGFFYQTIFYQKLPVPSDTLVGLYHPWRDRYAEMYPRGIPFKNFLITDPVRQQIPWRKLVVDSWKNGKRPAWNPYTFMGVPLNANIQAASFYPFNILFLFLDFPLAWSLLIILQPFLGGIFMYVYLRSLRLSQMASGIGMISWIFCGFAISWLTWGTIVHTALWLPLMLLCIDELTRLRKKAVHYFVWSLGLACGIIMTVLAGHIQVALYTLSLILIYFVYRVSKLHVKKVSIGWFIGAVLLSGICTIVQWGPMAQFVAESGRVDALNTWKNAGWFLPWYHLVQFVVPDFFGNPSTLNYWGEWNYGEFIGYIGIIPLIFASSVFGMKGLPRFFTIILGIALVMMVSNSVSRIPYIFHMPIVGSLQPTRLMVLVDFSLAVLSAFGFDYFVKKSTKYVYVSVLLYGIFIMALWMLVLGGKIFIPSKEVLDHLLVAKRNLILPTVLFVGFLVWFFVYTLVRKVRIRILGYLVLLVIIIVDIYRFGWKYTPFTDTSYFFPETRVIQFLRSQPKPFRIMSLDDRILPPNVSGYFGIESIEGYDPIAPKNYETFLLANEYGKITSDIHSGFNRIYTIRNIDSNLFPYFNVKYLLSLADIDRPFLKEVLREGNTRVYEYTNVIPRVYIADRIQRVDSDMAELDAVVSNPSGRVGVFNGFMSVLNMPLLGGETVEIYEYSSDTIKIKARVINERFLVILNRYDPHWTVTIDKDIRPSLIRANYLFMGVVVPSGTHDIILSYQ